MADISNGYRKIADLLLKPLSICGDTLQLGVQLLHLQLQAPRGGVCVCAAFVRRLDRLFPRLFGVSADLLQLGFHLSFALLLLSCRCLCSREALSTALRLVLRGCKALSCVCRRLLRLLDLPLQLADAALCSFCTLPQLMDLHTCIQCSDSIVSCSRLRCCRRCCAGPHICQLLLQGCSSVSTTLTLGRQLSGCTGCRIICLPHTGLQLCRLVRQPSLCRRQLPLQFGHLLGMGLLQSKGNNVGHLRNACPA